jgi:hypothetical protein
MNKIYFYLLYIPIGAFVIFSIGPYLKNRKYKNDNKECNAWVNQKPLDHYSIQACNLCEKQENFEQIIFRLPKAVKKTFFSYSETAEFNLFISVRCRICQGEIGRKKI